MQGVLAIIIDSPIDFFLATQQLMAGNARNKIQLTDGEETTDELGSLILNMGNKNGIL